MSEMQKIGSTDFVSEIKRKFQPLTFCHQVEEGQMYKNSPVGSSVQLFLPKNNLVSSDTKKHRRNPCIVRDDRYHSG